MFQFEFPKVLWGLLAMPLFALLLYAYWRWRNRALQTLGQTRRLLPDMAPSRLAFKSALVLCALALLVLSASNPRRGARQKVDTQKASDVYIAMDISKSMLCRDIAPSRIEMAKIFARKLVQQLEGERVGLIFFAGNAFLAVPLSNDYPFLIETLQNASPDLLTEQGTAIASALELADKSFDAESGGRAVVLLTDGENHDEAALESAATTYEHGALIYAVGVGTTDGAPIPDADWEGGQYKRDEKGNVVRSSINEALLRQLAEKGGGQTYNMAQQDKALNAIVEEVGNLRKKDHQVFSWTELSSWYQWFLLPAIVLLLVDLGLSFYKKD